MSEELKTLKEMRTMKDICGVVVDYSCDKRELKTEAIKWYKHHFQGYNEFKVCQFIKKFFNITDEDLK